MVDRQDYISRGHNDIDENNEDAEKLLNFTIESPSTRIAVIYKVGSKMIMYPVVGHEPVHAVENDIINGTELHNDSVEEDKTHVILNTGTISVGNIFDESAFSATLVDQMIKKSTLHVKHKFYSCELCNEAINTLNDLKNHIATHVHSVQNDRIKVDSLQHEQQETEENGGYRCVTCGGTFYHKYRFHLHRRFAHKHNDLYPCSTCGQVFKTIGSLNTHKRSHTRNRCNICGASFTTPSYLRAHMKKHAKSQYSCNFCNNKFRYSFKLKNHEKVHSKEQTYKCFVCNNTFNQITNLQSHICDLDCQNCGKKCRDLTRLKDHQMVCKTRSLKCETCGESFQTKGKLKEHHQTHSLDETHYCRLCKKVFVSNLKLAVHLQNHATCEVCGKLMKSKIHLKSHMNSHTHEKAFVCEICGKHYFFKSNLKRHQIIHTGEKPYLCEICGKAFNDVSSRNVHRKIHDRKT